MSISFGLLATGLIGGLIGGLTGHLTQGIWKGIGIGLGLGLVLTLSITSLEVAWPSYSVARCWLALRHKLPWRMMAFLSDAHHRGVLRQVGSVYQFRHIELQHRLASAGPNPHPRLHPGRQTITPGKISSRRVKKRHGDSPTGG